MTVSNKPTHATAASEPATVPSKVAVGFKEFITYHNPKKYAVAELEANIEAQSVEALEVTT